MYMSNWRINQLNKKTGIVANKPFEINGKEFKVAVDDYGNIDLMEYSKTKRMWQYSTIDVCEVIMLVIEKGGLPMDTDRLIEVYKTSDMLADMLFNDGCRTNNKKQIVGKVSSYCKAMDFTPSEVKTIRERVIKLIDEKEKYLYR